MKTNIGKLIDADKLKLEFPHDSDWDYPVNTNSYVHEIIDEQPEAVIKCKDCVFKYFNEIEDDYLCARYGTNVFQHINDDCFCSWAERRQ